MRGTRIVNVALVATLVIGLPNSGNAAAAKGPTEGIRRAGPAIALSAAEPPDRARAVAVFVDQSFGSGQPLVDVLNSNPRIRATEMTRNIVEAGGLRRFDCVVVRVYGPPESELPTEATVQALNDFVGSGGGYVGEWWGSGAALTEAAPSVDGDYFIPARFLGLFSGAASDGGVVATDTPITITQDHPVVKGLPDVFSSEGGTEYFVRAVAPFDPELITLATYEGHGGTNPAIMVGATGSFVSGTASAVLLFFDAIDLPADVYLSRLWVNSVTFACTHQAS